MFKDERVLREDISSQSNVSYNQALRSHMIGIYNYMMSALVVSGFTALFTYNSPSLMNLVYSTPLFYLCLFSPLIISLVFSFKIQTMSVSLVRILFFVFSVSMGLSLAYIFVIYTYSSVAKVFFITASVFGSMSLYGYTTKKDLSSMGSFLIMGLFGIIIASVVNILLESKSMDFVISLLGVVIFTGLTAYYTQQIKRDFYSLVSANTSTEVIQKYSIIGALNLYMSFINLFLFMLRFLGDRR